jgi:tetratricopeptide (TPR) repeat protein
MQVRLIRVVVLMLGLALATTACGKYSIKSIRSLTAFKDGLVFYQKSEFAKAAASFEEAVKRDPDLGLAYFFLGNSYDQLYKPGKKGDPDNDANLPKAVEAYKKAVEKLNDPADPNQVKYRKLSYEYLIAAFGPEKINDFAQAEPIANQLIQLEPNEPGNYEALGRLYEEQGRYEEAEPMFKKAIEVKPSDPLGYQILAGYYDRQGDFDKMIDAFMQRANMEPNNPEAWHTLGTYYFAKIQKNPKLPKDLARSYVKAGLDAEDKALAINAEYPEALTYKSLLLRLQANIETDPAVQKKLLADADTFHSKAVALQAKLMAEGTAAGKK